MLEAVVRYLHAARIPFRLTSRPSAEPLPHLAYRVPIGAVLADTKVVRVGGAAVLACFPMGANVELPGLSAALGEPVLAGGANDLPSALRNVRGSIPPLGKLFGLPLVIDSRVAEANVIVFHAFSESDVLEMAYDDFARLETPRVASFAVAGELGSRGPAHQSR